MPDAVRSVVLRVVFSVLAAVSMCVVHCAFAAEFLPQYLCAATNDSTVFGLVDPVNVFCLSLCLFSILTIVRGFRAVEEGRH